MDNPVTITFDAKHLPVLRRALECFTRLRSGQIDIALDEAYADKHSPLGVNHDHKMAIEKMVRSIYFPELRSPNAALSVGQYGYGGEEAYEISQVIRRFLAYERNEGFLGDGVDFYPPMKYSGVPHPVVHEFNNKKFFPSPNEISHELMQIFTSGGSAACFDFIDARWHPLPKGSSMEVCVRDGLIGLLVSDVRR